MYVPVSRPILYGLFLRLTSLKFSLWLTIFWQCTLLSSVLFCFLTMFIKRNGEFYFIMLIIILTFGSNASWHANQMIPDIFTSITILTIACLLRPDRISIAKKCFLSLSYLLACGVHFSNVIIGFCTFILGVFFLLLIKRFTLTKNNTNSLVYSLILVSLSLLIIPSTNVIFTKRFFFSESGHVFLLGRMLHDGILYQYLDEKCDQKKISALCLQRWTSQSFISVYLGRK